eukprot:TRINITY_DN8943_c0_g1_i3.p1 TRINITY_DN8943_c0_g1~~TRINITY_DN8943_c0_g1_i3.p1  ORF type:complete len:728 (+),score=104.72 TRINITY_DN8943_c0_g1_i3:51-2234(+)
MRYDGGQRKGVSAVRILGLVLILVVMASVFLSVSLFLETHNGGRHTVVDSNEAIASLQTSQPKKQDGITVVVLSMHRSGSSMMMGLLDRMGFFVGASSDLFDAAPDNPKGFFERRDVVGLNKKIFEFQSRDGFENSLYFSVNTTGKSAQKRINKAVSGIMNAFRGKKAIAIKDPRMCLTLPFWAKHFKNPFYIILYRNPLEVAKSLEHRSKGKVSLDLGIRLWEKYTISAINFTTGYDRILVSHEQLRVHPEAVLNSVQSRISALANYGLQPLNQAQIKDWVDPTLIHETQDTKETTRKLTDHQAKLFKSLEDGSALVKSWNRLEDEAGNTECEVIPRDSVCPEYSNFKTSDLKSVKSLRQTISKAVSTAGFRIPSYRAAKFPISKDCRSHLQSYLCLQKFSNIACHTQSVMPPIHWGHSINPVSNFLQKYYDVYKPLASNRKVEGVQSIPRIAYLLMAHNSFSWIQRLVQSIYDPENYYYIHIDIGPESDQNRALFEKVKKSFGKYRNVIVMDHRLRVRWGGSSIVAVQLAGIIQALSNSEWDYWINLSENDYPLKSQAHIRKYLSNYPGKNFVTLRKTEDKLKELRGYRLKYLFVECQAGVFKSNQIQVLPPQLKLARGEQWVILHRDFCNYLVFDLRPRQLWFYFQSSYIPDESFIHTVLKDSFEFSDSLVDDHLRYIHMPHNIIGMSEIKDMQTSDKLFARKFNDSRILTEIDKWLKPNQKKM